MEKAKKVFRSRISLLLSAITLAIFVSVSIPIFQSGTYDGLHILGGTLFFIIFLFTGIRYIISGERLYLKIWFIPMGSTNIADMMSVKRSYNPLSSPAASLKRLRINFRSGICWLISPAGEKRFIEELKAVNPDIEIDVADRKGALRVWDWDI